MPIFVLYSDYTTSKICNNPEFNFEYELNRNETFIMPSMDDFDRMYPEAGWIEFWILYNLADENSKSKAEKLALQIARKTCCIENNELCCVDIRIIGVSSVNPPYDYNQLFSIAINEKSIEFTQEQLWPELKYSVISAANLSHRKLNKNNLIIDGLTNRREGTVWAGIGGVGKSLLMDNIALTVGCMKKLWQFDVKRPLISLMIQSENTSKVERIQKMLSARPDLAQGAQKFFILTIKDDCRVSGDFTNIDFYGPILEQSKKINADLWIFDPLISFHHAMENDNTNMRRVLDILQTVIDQANVAVFITHHFSRENKWRGASAIRDWCSNMFLLNLIKIENGEALIEIIHDKARNFIQQNPFYLKRTIDLDFIQVAKPGSKNDKYITAVVQALSDAGGKVECQNQLYESIQKILNCSITTARRAISLALESRTVIIEPNKNSKTSSLYLGVQDLISTVNDLGKE